MTANANFTEPLLVLCRDLLFVSKITATAATIGLPVKVVRDPTKLQDHPEARRLIVDLNQDGFSEAAAQWKRQTDGHVTGFVGHADTDAIERASAAGIDAVLARGVFVARLEEILRGG
jgi:hypothetical protein